ncbi:MAG: hypothetical protein A3H32_02110 [Betaproteobacteria bacterium RIFCSPLOWO2_02_FULL_63_19]|nr:MAG: hypothetical protein A3H32_02110 [Betaproteobacteria bacterium RIFCSPLOWO2_02_FULL_63_19]
MIALAVALASGAASAPALAQVEVKSAWVRATVAAQKTGGAYMEITSAKDATLIGAQTPVAGAAEVHETRMENNVMRMRAVPRLALPAGKTVQFKPGGYHLMLVDLKRPLKKGETVPLRLTIENKDKSLATVEVNAEVRDLRATAPMDMHK